MEAVTEQRWIKTTISKVGKRILFDHKYYESIVPDETLKTTDECGKLNIELNQKPDFRAIPRNRHQLEEFETGKLLILTKKNSTNSPQHFLRLSEQFIASNPNISLILHCIPFSGDFE